MNDFNRVVLDNPIDEEFSVKECAVQKRTESKKSNEDETSYTSGISDETSDDFTSGLSQEIRPAKQGKAHNIANSTNPNSTNPSSNPNNTTITSITSTTSNNNAALNTSINFQQQQQYLQQQQNLHQLLHAQKIQTSTYSNANSTSTTPTLVINPNQATLNTPDQSNKQTGVTIGLSTLKSGQTIDPTVMEELLLKQSQSYYMQNTNASATNARVSLTQAPILMQLARQSSQAQPQQQQQQQQQQQPTLSQHSLSRQNSTQQQIVATKQLQPQPTQKNLNSHYLSTATLNNSISSTSNNTIKPIIQQQGLAIDTVLKNKPTYSTQETNYSNNNSIPMIISTSQPPPQQQLTQSQSIHPPSQSVPPILPNLQQHIDTNQQKPTTSSMYDRSNSIKKAILDDKAKSFNEYKAYLDYLKNGTCNSNNVIKNLESQIEAAKTSNTNQFPNRIIVRPYNPNEASLVKINNTTPNTNNINTPITTTTTTTTTTTNNHNHNHNNISSNINSNIMNNMSMLSINSISNNNNNNNNNSFLIPSLMKIQYFPQQSQQPTFSGISQHHQQQMSSNRIKFNTNQQFTNLKSNNPLIQPSYTTFASFNQNQNFMNNSNNNNNNKVSYFPTMSQRVINKTSYHPVQSNNMHPNYFHGHGF